MAPVLPPVLPPVTYAVSGEKSSPKFARAFAVGCKGHATNDDQLHAGDVALFGSPARRALLEQAQREGRNWYYGDHGLFRRFQYYRVTRNQYQHNGQGAASPHRFEALRVSLAPDWQRSGTSIVICPNSPVYMRWFGYDAQTWAAGLVARLLTMTDRPIVVRWKAQASTRPLYIDLHNAYLVVAFSSAAAIEALAAGVPVCTLAPWASTARMGITDIGQIESPIYPSIQARDAFLFNLANQQWTLDEIERGQAWRALT